jgi:hypothetical protein
MQSAASPTAAAALAKSNALIDTRPLLPSIHVPALVLSRRDDPVGPGPTGRYLAERIPGARFVELARDEHLPWLGDPEAQSAEIEHFVTGVRPQALEPGVVRAILLCDLEGASSNERRPGLDDGAALFPSPPAPGPLGLATVYSRADSNHGNESPRGQLVALAVRWRLRSRPELRQLAPQRLVERFRRRHGFESRMRLSLSHVLRVSAKRCGSLS